MAFVLVQHLDPTHESMMVDLLAGSTPMTVRQATDGMPIAPDHVYVIPPGACLAVGDGTLHISPPQAPHGARLPFDFLLRSLAEACGERAVAVILSGTGADGSLGLKSVKQNGGLVIAQDPGEAAFDGMPRNAIMTGAVDLILPVAKIAAALLDHDRRLRLALPPAPQAPERRAKDCLARVVDLLRARTAHDFSLNKEGTLRRRIERRMAMSAAQTDDIERYLEFLRSAPAEVELLARELLINVTGFFRDRKVFDLLAKKIVPDLVRTRPPGQPLRIWVAGCSTGEETYSLAMLCHEAIAAAHSGIKLQVFASDVDPDAIAAAREGRYPATIAADVAPERLARFFLKEGDYYRVLPDLRSAVVFAVQDVLSDPPFSRLELVSCRNLLIYLLPEAQAKVVSLFHFALREGGLLLLGTSETVGDAGGRFEAVAGPERVYRRVGRSRPGEFGSLARTADDLRGRPRPAPGRALSRQAALAELCRRHVLETYAPATVLINRAHECLYSLGPTERYLRVAPGQPTQDLLAMAHPALRTRLRAAIQQASQENARVTIADVRLTQDGKTASFSIDDQPVPAADADLLLVCFVAAPVNAQTSATPVPPQDVSRVGELERELDATRTELQGAIRNLEISNEEQKALNEELAALNSQLQETLDRQRTTTNDLQNVLYSTDVATLFLDTGFNIRFFAPATRSLFNVIPGDVGRPLADLHSLADHGTLLTDAKAVLQTQAPHEREIEPRNGAWFLGRILPYRTEEHGIAGVVITFAAITERRRIADALAAASPDGGAGEHRQVAVSRRRQPRPAPAAADAGACCRGCWQGPCRERKRSTSLPGSTRRSASCRPSSTRCSTSTRSNSGAVQAAMVDFPIGDLLERLRDEFAYHAQARGLELAETLRRMLRHDIPVVILTGDISARTARDIAQHTGVLLNKPVQLEALTEVIGRLLPVPQAVG